MQQVYTAGQVQPFWQIKIGEQWVEVRATVESEAPGGANNITFMFDESTKTPAIKLRKDEVVTARPPEFPLNFE